MRIAKVTVVVLVAVAVFAALRHRWQSFQPMRDLGWAVKAACDRYVARSSEPGLFAYLKSKGFCDVARKAVLKRWKDTSPDTAAFDGVRDACLLLATDPSKSADSEELRIPHYAVVPAHFARDHVDRCEAAAATVAEDIGGSTRRDVR